MPKRPVTVQSESESEDDHAKRARTDDPSDSEDDEDDRAGPRRPTQIQRGGNARGRGRAARTDNDDSDVEADVVIPIAADDEEFEKKHQDKVRAQIESKITHKKGIAEYGIIEAIEVENFMCHPRLSFKFGPQINFIIGHNGSGKSAVLSALTIALGGKTNSTGRGNGLKSFIREGESSAKVKIKIKNQGPEAFKSQEYGQSIYISRRFTKEGGSGWRIESEHGQLVSTKRDELSAICDHMNVQVDNPMNVLTQDSARQFLSASHPQDKYKFFLLGTQLFQLSTEYDTCLENIRKTARVLAEKKEAIPDLRRRYQEELQVFREAEKAREQKKKLDDLKRELAWSHVRAKEEELEEKLADVITKQNRIPKIQEGLEKAEEALEAQNGAVAACESEVTKLGSVDHLNDRRIQLTEESRSNKKVIMGYATDIKQMKTSIAALQGQVNELQGQIDAEQLRMAAHSQAKRDELDRKIKAVKAELDEADAAIAAINARKLDQTQKSEALKNEGMAAAAEVQKLRNKLMDAQNMAARAKESMKDAFLPYGNNIKGVLDEIKRCTWKGDAPLGPLGLYVRAKEPEKWGDILRGQLASLLTAFAVTHPSDRDQLNKILLKYRNRNTIIIYEKDMFDYSAGEPSPQYHTVLRALEISDPYVVRILINQSHIENLVLSRTRKELETELKQLRGGVGWSLDRFSVRVFPEGGIASHGLQNRRLNDATSLLLTGRDSQAEIAHHEQEQRRLEVELNQVTQTEVQFRNRHKQARDELTRIEVEGRAAFNKQRKIKSNLNVLQGEANEELPTGVAGFQLAKEEAEAEIASHEAQMEVAEAAMKKEEETQRTLLNQIKEIKEQLGQFAERKTSIETKLQEAVGVRLQKQANVKYYKDKLKKEEDAVTDAEGHAKVTQEEFTTWTLRATEYCEKVEGARKAETVQRELDSVTKALHAREKRHGKSVEEMTVALNKAKAALEKVEKEWRQMSTLNKALRASLLVRLHRWQEFRRHIALRCRLIFAYHLSHRGYYGKVLFNHEAQTLTLRVQTDDQLQAQGTAEKDPRSLSGGEKSFSTICLLLSLWDSIGCPLRCLDEFDVFMDAVNRRISMKMMIDTATANPDKQYILITPQDMTNIRISDNVHVHRMDDPVRGNALGFPRAA